MRGFFKSHNLIDPSADNFPDSKSGLKFFMHAQWFTYVGRSPPAVCEGTCRVEPVVDVLLVLLARLPSEKAALFRRFRCTEFELRARVAIKLDASWKLRALERLGGT